MTLHIALLCVVFKMVSRRWNEQKPSVSKASVTAYELIDRTRTVKLFIINSSRCWLRLKSRDQSTIRNKVEIVKINGKTMSRKLSTKVESKLIKENKCFVAALAIGAANDWFFLEINNQQTTMRALPTRDDLASTNSFTFRENVLIYSEEKSSRVQQHAPVC